MLDLAVPEELKRKFPTRGSWSTGKKSLWSRVPEKRNTKYLKKSLI
jgi:hypothetical protein